MLAQALNFLSFLLLVSLAIEDLYKRQVSLYKILALGLSSWLQAWSQARPAWSPLRALVSSGFFCALVLLMQLLEKIRGRFYLGPADLLVLAALAPQEGGGACLLIAALASCFCLMSMGLLALLRILLFPWKSLHKKQGQGRLALPLLPFYCVTWLILPLVH